MNSIDPAKVNQEIVDWAFCQDCGGPKQKLVLVVLAILSDEYGNVFIETRDLQRYTELSKRSLRAAVNSLRKQGYLAKTGSVYWLVDPETPPSKRKQRHPLYVKAEIRNAVYERDGRQCIACGSTQNLQIDHIVPQSRGGCHDIENLQTLCGTCNLEKGDRTQDEWEQTWPKETLQ